MFANYISTLIISPTSTFSQPTIYSAVIHAKCVYIKWTVSEKLNINKEEKWQGKVNIESNRY